MGTKFGGNGSQNDKLSTKQQDQPWLMWSIAQHQPRVIFEFSFLLTLHIFSCMYSQVDHHPEPQPTSIPTHFSCSSWIREGGLDTIYMRWGSAVWSKRQIFIFVGPIFKGVIWTCRGDGRWGFWTALGTQFEGAFVKLMCPMSHPLASGLKSSEVAVLDLVVIFFST